MNNDAATHVTPSQHIYLALEPHDGTAVHALSSNKRVAIKGKLCAHIHPGRLIDSKKDQQMCVCVRLCAPEEA